MVSRPLNTSHVADTSGIDASSLDELALSKLGRQSPLAPRSTNTKLQKVNLGATPKLQLSPKKYLYLETPGVQGSSPTRIKVTMQAEQVDSQDEPGTPSKRGRPKTKVIKVPLKDADEPVKRKPGRPRKSDIEPSAVQKRKATPIRRHSKRLSGSSEVQDDIDVQVPPAKKRGRPSKIAPQTDSGVDTKSPKKKVGRPKKSSQADAIEEPGQPSKIIPQAEPGVEPVDEGYMDDEQADEEQAGNNEATFAEQDLLEPPTGSSDGVTPMSDLPSVGQSPHYYMGRRKSEAFRNPTSPRLAGSPKSRKDDDSNSIRQHPYQESAESSSLRQPSTEAQAGLEFRRASQFDFANLTPLHEKHTIQPTELTQPHMPAQSTPRPKAGGPILDRQNMDEPKNLEQPLRKSLFLQRSESPENAQELFSTSGLFREPTPVPSEFGESQPSEHESTTSSEARNDEQNQDEEMWRRQIANRDHHHSSDREATPASDSDDSEYGGIDEMTGRPMGEVTLMQSEEFSMVSLDSLESVRDQNSSFVGSQVSLSMNEPQRTPKTFGNIPQQPSLKNPSKLNQAWLPESSPGAHLSPNVSVLRGRQSPRPLSSPYPPKSPSNGGKPSPRHQSQKDVSRRLGSRLSLSDLESSPVGAAPISSFLQSNIRQSLGNGSLPGERTENNDNSLTEPPLAPHSANGRLPTPNSADKESQSTSSSRLETRPDPAGQQFQRSTALESDQSPTRSDSVASMQSQTPPATERGSSPILEDATDLVQNTTFQQLPSSPPARIERSSGLEESRAWLRTQNAMEQTWRKAKQQLSPPSQSQNRSIMISDDQSDSDESEEEGEPEKDKSMAVEEDIEDLWQEEASRGSNVDDSNLSNRSRNGTSQLKRKLFSTGENPQSSRQAKVPRTSKPFSGSPEQEHAVQNKLPQNRPQSSRLTEFPRTSRSFSASAEQNIPAQAKGLKKTQPSRLTKVPRTSKPFSASPQQVFPIENKKQPTNHEQERQKKVPSTIDDLFKNIAGSSTHHEPQDKANSIKPVDLMFPPSSSSSSKGTSKAQKKISITSSRVDSSLLTKPARSSQLRHQFSPEVDASLANQTDSFVSVASDVQQLRNEMASSHNPPSKERRSAPRTTSAQVYSTRTTTQKVPVNLRSIDDSIQIESGRYDSSSLLSLNPKQTAQPLFQANRGQSTKPAAAKSAQPIEPIQLRAATQPRAAQHHEQPRVREQTMKSAPPATPGPGIFTRLKTHIPFLNASADISINGPPRPKHALLSNLPLLPMTLPFTKTHYTVLEELWKRYKAAPELFLTSLPENAGLMTKSLNKWSDARLSEWGYECTLKASSLILVALYCRLLVLKDAQEFRSVEGKELEMGEPGRLWIEQREQEKAEGKTKWKKQLIIGEAYVTVRLFSVMICENVREDESQGVKIDRELRFKWKASGERGWNFSFLVDE